MNVVDSSGWIEFLTRGPNGPFFRSVIQDIENLLVPTITIYEVLKRVRLDTDEETAIQSIGVMLSGVIVELDRAIAIEAALISVRYQLAMADSIILATAQAYDAILWTQDAHFKEIEGVQYIEKKA